MTLSKSEGQAQALRGLVELAVIELVGKLTQTPYWSCIGGDPNANEEIRRRWPTGSTRWRPRASRIIAYFQNQLRRRGFYDGPVDGEFNPAIDEAVANYRAALGPVPRAEDRRGLLRGLLTPTTQDPRRPRERAAVRRGGAAGRAAPQRAAARRRRAGSPWRWRCGDNNRRTSSPASRSA
jgi:hypothetical protein